MLICRTGTCTLIYTKLQTGYKQLVCTCSLAYIVIYVLSYFKRILLFLSSEAKISTKASKDSSLASFFSIARILRFCNHSSPIDALKYVLIRLRAEKLLSQWAVVTTIVMDIWISFNNVGKAFFNGNSSRKRS